MLNEDAKNLGYTVISEDAEKELGIKLPEMEVESKTAEDVKVQYAVTPDGTVFGWPPVEQDGIYYASRNNRSKIYR